MFHLRSTVEMPDEWLVVTPDGGGLTGGASGPRSTKRTRRSTSTSVTGSTRRVAGSDKSAAECSADRDPVHHSATSSTRQRSGSSSSPAAVRSPLRSSSFDDGVRSGSLCSRAHGLCVTDDGQVVLDHGRPTASGTSPAAARRRARAPRRTSPARCGKRCAARVIDSRLPDRAPHRRARPARCRGRTTVEHHALMWARVELDDLGAPCSKSRSGRS